MKDLNYPNYFQAADKYSLKSQNKYLWLFRIDLFVMIIAASLAMYSYQLDDTKRLIYSVTLIFLVVSIVLTIILRCMQYEDKWYRGRAFAESCKTLTWRFITCSDGFRSDLSEDESKRLFIDKIEEIANEYISIGIKLDAKIPVVTTEMLYLRCKSLPERRNNYVSYRIKEQKEWYLNKSYYHKLRYKCWFLFVIISQIIALISIMYLICRPETIWNFVGLFTTIASAGISWLQLRQHQQLKQAYNTAADELSSIELLASSVNSEDEFSSYVVNSENAISREHTAWIAKRID